MKIIFITGGLEPGADGVGDYTRRLAAECIRQGHQCRIVSLNDKCRQKAETLKPETGNDRQFSAFRFQVSTFTELQESEGTYLECLRLPGLLCWPERVELARDWVSDLDPDWVSLQFVPFGFHPKGLCFGVGKRLATIASQKKWHVMFHELWLGLDENSSAKHRIWGALQRMIVLDVVNRLRPHVVHTQAEPYRKVLEQERINASILPLFSNIPYVNGDGWATLVAPMLAQQGVTSGERGEINGEPGAGSGKSGSLLCAPSSQPAQPTSELRLLSSGFALSNPSARCSMFDASRHHYYLAGVFGGVYPEWNAEQTVSIILPLVQRFQKKLVLVFLGKNNLTLEASDKLKFTLRNRAEVIMAGERNSLEISQILQSLDLGLATTPRQIIQKSGSVAAMLEHGLPVLVTRDDWHLRGAGAQLEEIHPRLLSPRQFALMEALPRREVKPSAAHGVERVAGEMLSPLALFS